MTREELDAEIADLEALLEESKQYADQPKTDLDLEVEREVDQPKTDLDLERDVELESES